MIVFLMLRQNRNVRFSCGSSHWPFVLSPHFPEQPAVPFVPWIIDWWSVAFSMPSLTVQLLLLLRSCYYLNSDLTPPRVMSVLPLTPSSTVTSFALTPLYQIEFAVEG
jgi:hypothetical protein